MRKLLTTVMGLVLLASASFSQAENEKFPPFYLGLYGGKADLEVDFEEFGVYEDDSDNYGLVFGVHYNKYVAVELSYIDFGDFNDEVFGFGLDAKGAYTIAAIGKWPIANIVAPYVEFGFTSWDLKDSSGTEIGGTDLNYGAGILVKLTKRIELDFSYQYYDQEINPENIISDDPIRADFTLESTSVGLRYHFL